MVGIDTLNEGDSLRQDGDIAFHDAFNHLGCRQLTTAHATALQVGVDDGWLCYATIDLQTSIFCAVLGMFHNSLLLAIGYWLNANSQQQLFNIDGNDDFGMFGVVGNHEDTRLGTCLQQLLSVGLHLEFCYLTRL